MMHLQIAYPLLSYTQACALLIKETIKELGYEVLLKPLGESSDYDILVLEPEVSELRWLDVLIKSRRQLPGLPVILYSLEMDVRDGLQPLSEDPGVFLVNDLYMLQKNFQHILNYRISNEKQIVLVDDDPNILKAYERSLRKMPWRLHPAGSAQKALEILDSHPVDLLVTDIKMPGMHGFDLIRKVREANAELPIIICSAYQNMKEDKDLHFHKISAFLEKPVEMNDLRDIMQKTLADKELP
jgi:CheY-like chemotaxis protein